MTILAETTGWGAIMTNVLLVVHVVVCILLCLVVLMQRPKQEGLGAAFGGGMTDQAFGARTTDVLQKGTVYLASILFVVTLVLSILVGSKSRETSFSEDVKNLGEEAIETNGPAAAAAAAAISEGDIADQVKKAMGEGEDGGADVPSPVTPDPATPDPATPDPATPEPVTPEPATPEPATPEPATPEPAAPADPVTPADPANSGQ